MYNFATQSNITMKILNIRFKLRPRHIALMVLFAIVTSFKMLPGLGDAYTFCIYPKIGVCLSSVSGIVPFALGDFFIAMSILWVIAYPIYSIAYKKRGKKKTLCLVAEYLIWVYVWFYAAWGLNYSQQDVYQRIGMPPVEVATDDFLHFANDYADSLNATYTKAIPNDIKQRAWQNTLQGYRQLKAMGINRPFNSNAHAKTMLFSRLSSMAGVTGSMAPFFCEFTLNTDIRRHEYPAIYAHEYAHMLGIANEGEANFYSYLVCTASADRAVRFSGYYNILFYMLRNAHELLDEREYDTYIGRINPEIIRLAQTDREYWLSLHSPIIDKTQNFIYNLYLEGNQVEGGMKSYSGVTGIIMAWEKYKKVEKYQ